MKIAPAESGISIVLTGSMNPAIMSPEWLGRHKVLPQDVVDAADIQVIHKEVTVFRAGWCAIHVDRDRFQAATSEAPYVRLCDLVTKVFGELLPSTPVNALGINFTVHFNAPSAAARNRFAQTLVPATNWGAWGKSVADELAPAMLGSHSPAALKNKRVKSVGAPPITKHGGLVSVTMQQKQVDDRDEGAISVRVEPSAKLTTAGIFIEVNDHYVIAAQQGPPDALAYAQLLDGRFDASLKRSESILDQLMELAHE